MPLAPDIAVVGAGITGLAVALHLAERGAAVCIYERDEVGAGASRHAPGGIRLQWGTRLNCRMSLAAFDFWRAVDARLGTETPLGFSRCGYLFLAHSQRTLEALAANVALQRELRIPARIVSAEEAAKLAPGLRADNVAGGAFCGEDGYFDRPRDVVAAFAAAVRRQGVEIERAEVAALSPHDGAWRLRFADGTDAFASHAVVCAYHETPALLAPLDVAVPIRRVSRFLFFSEPLDERVLDPLVVSPERQFATKQLADGRLVASYLGAAWSSAGREADRRSWRERIGAAQDELFPDLTRIPLVTVQEGPYDMTPDGQAVLGAVPGLDRLWLAAGFSGHGFMMAPVVGASVAAVIAGEPPDEYVRALSVERFARGELIPEPAVI